MKVEVIKKILLDELVAQVRRVPLMQRAGDGSEIRVYQNASIFLRRTDPREVNPTSFYLVRGNLQFQRNLRATLMEQGIDTLQLEGALEIRVDDADQVWALMPPVVEVTSRKVRYIPAAGEIDYEKTQQVQIPVINDGVHRVWIAREADEFFNGLWVARADPAFPFYAHPNSWDDMREVDAVPSSRAAKKLYSKEDCYALYRDFGVLGCGAPRPLGPKG